METACELGLCQQCDPPTQEYKEYLELRDAFEEGRRGEY